MRCPSRGHGPEVTVPRFGAAAGRLQALSVSGAGSGREALLSSSSRHPAAGIQQAAGCSEQGSEGLLACYEHPREQASIALTPGGRVASLSVFTSGEHSAGGALPVRRRVTRWWVPPRTPAGSSRVRCFPTGAPGDRGDKGAAGAGLDGPAGDQGLRGECRSPAAFPGRWDLARGCTWVGNACHDVFLWAKPSQMVGNCQELSDRPVGATPGLGRSRHGRFPLGESRLASGAVTFQNSLRVGPHVS